MANWRIRIGDQQVGPLTLDELVGWARAGRLRMTDLVWTPGMPQWKPAGQVPQLVPLLRAGAPPPAAKTSLADDRVARMVIPVGRSPLSIVAGYMGLLSPLVLPAPLAVLFGIMALRDIKKNPNLLGKGRAIFALIMGGLVILFLGVLGIAAMLKP
ncbi:MAG: GYF domain-containing protein [Thermoanaerobaculia bacterium]